MSDLPSPRFLLVRRFFIRRDRRFRGLFSLLVFLGLGLVFAACSQYNTAPASRAYHNLTSKFNAYLQAKEQLDEAEKALYKTRIDNYGQQLDLLPPLDSLSAQAVATQLDAVLKKASLVAERHQNAKWLDNAYLLIGTVRMYRGDFKNAIETFKYINTNADEGDPDTRHAALVGLMRAYVEQGEYANGLRVADLLRTLPLSREHTRDYYLTKALLHQRRGERAVAAALVEEALPLMKRGERKARLLYAQGQLLDGLGKADQAAARYAAVLKNNPSYDLGFYADLNRLMNGTGKEAEFNFTRMLDDRKNADLKDRLFYAMAMKELGRKNYRQAEANLRLSAKYAAGKTDQLAFTYLKLAELNYDPLRRYENASAYYDSTVSLLPPSVPNYVQISERQKVLREFVKATTVLRTEDSLQRLAGMNPAALDKYLEKIILDQKQREADEVARAQQIAANAQQEAQFTAGTDAAFGDKAQTGLWYFYNASSVTRGRQEFQQKWGTRVLEDNWRRSTKDVSLADVAPTGSSSNPNQPAISVVTPGRTDNLKGEKDRLMAQIPFGPSALATSKQRQEEAQFQVGKIYQLNLREPAEAIRTFDELLVRFPQTTHEPEVLYLLSLAHDGTPKQSDYRQKLTSKFPDSYFARLLLRGNEGPLTAGAQTAAQRSYTEAYARYGQGQYPEALTQVEQALRDYPGNPLEDKFALLRVMLLGKTSGPSPYHTALSQFIQNYPASPLQTMAKEMLAVVTQSASSKGN